MASVVFGSDFVEAVLAYSQGDVSEQDVKQWSAPDALDCFLRERKIPKTSEIGSYFMSLVEVRGAEEPGLAMEYDPEYQSRQSSNGLVDALAFPVRTQ